LLAGQGCRDAEPRRFESYPPRFAAWAKAAERPLAPERFSPRCPGRAAKVVASMTVQASAAPQVRFPRDGARFVVDPAGPARQEIVLAARPGGDGRAVRFVLDGRTLGTVTAPFELPWALAPGLHRFELETQNGPRAEPVMFEVSDAR
jgi:penicillin-binding protein 1C